MPLLLDLPLLPAGFVSAEIAYRACFAVFDNAFHEKAGVGIPAKRPGSLADRQVPGHCFSLSPASDMPSTFIINPLPARICSIGAWQDIKPLHKGEET